MKNKMFVIFVTIIMLLIVVTGCTNHNGIYYHETNASSYMELGWSDSLTIYYPNDMIKGEYFIEGSQIKFLVMDKVTAGKIENNIIIDANGVNWIKK